MLAETFNVLNPEAIDVYVKFLTRRAPANVQKWFESTWTRWVKNSGVNMVQVVDQRVSNSPVYKMLLALSSKLDVSLSGAQGMGVFSYVTGDISDQEAEEIYSEGEVTGEKVRVYMDYVKGRAVKFEFTHDRKTGQVEFDSTCWFDRRERDLQALIEEVRK
jgi:hypothetical protein